MVGGEIEVIYAGAVQGDGSRIAGTQGFPDWIHVGVGQYRLNLGARTVVFNDITSVPICVARGGGADVMIDCEYDGDSSLFVDMRTPAGVPVDHAFQLIVVRV